MHVNPRATEADLIARTRAGAADALGELYTRHASSVMALAYRLTGSRADAEDVLHDVFLGLPEALRRYDERGQLGAWIRRVAARAALSRLRTRARKREVPLDSVDEPRHPGDADAHAARATLEQAIAALPDSLRIVFVLREIDGHTHAEIGTLLGITPGASEVRLCRAIRQLRTLLRDSD